MCLALRSWLLEWQKQYNSAYFRNVRKTIGNFEQYLPDRLAALLHDYCRNVAGVYSCGTDLIVGLNSRCVSLCLEYKQTVLRRREFVCMLRIKQHKLHLKISLFTFSKESSTLPQNGFKNVCNKAGSCIASALMSGDILARYNFYIRITQSIQNPINIKFEKTFNQLIAYLAVKLKKTLAINREAPSEIYVPQCFKPKTKKSVIAPMYFLLH